MCFRDYAINRFETDFEVWMIPWYIAPPYRKFCFEVAPYQNENKLPTCSINLSYLRLSSVLPLTEEQEFRLVVDWNQDASCLKYVRNYIRTSVKKNFFFFSTFPELCKFWENLSQSLLFVPTVMLIHLILKFPPQILFSFWTSQNVVSI